MNYLSLSIDLLITNILTIHMSCGMNTIWVFCPHSKIVTGLILIHYRGFQIIYEQYQTPRNGKYSTVGAVLADHLSCVVVTPVNGRTESPSSSARLV